MLPTWNEAQDWDGVLPTVPLGQWALDNMSCLPLPAALFPLQDRAILPFMLTVFFQDPRPMCVIL